MHPLGTGRQLAKILAADAQRDLLIAGLGVRLALAAKARPRVSDDLRRKDTPDRRHHPKPPVHDKANECLFLHHRRRSAESPVQGSQLGVTAGKHGRHQPTSHILQDHVLTPCIAIAPFDRPLDGPRLDRHAGYLTHFRARRRLRLPVILLPTRHCGVRLVASEYAGYRPCSPALVSSVLTSCVR